MSGIDRRVGGLIDNGVGSVWVGSIGSNTMAYLNQITYEWDRSRSRAEKGVRSRTYLSWVRSGFRTRGSFQVERV